MLLICPVPKGACPKRRIKCVTKAIRNNMGQKSAEERIGEFLRFGSKLGLERMTELMHRLGDPQDDLNVIHIAGTNGKGSTSRYIYESLIEAGYSAGIYTSPFIEKFNERIEANRKVISDDDLDRCTDLVIEKVREMTSEGLESPTEFEVVTAVAFLWFKKIGCDAVVLEVGLGGRGDSTNIVKSPVITVITSISYDHMDRLGSTITEIATEKAGIIKAGCPVVVSTEREDAMDVFRAKSSAMNAPLYDAREIMAIDIHELRPDGATFSLNINDLSSNDENTPCPEKTRLTSISQNDKERLTSISLDSGDRHNILHDLNICMGGEHQVINAAEAVTALLVQNKFDVSVDAIRRGLARAKQPGRFEIMYKPAKVESQSSGPWVLIDGAHNKDAAKKLKAAVKQFFPGKSVLFVCGVLKDKDVSGILDEFAGTESSDGIGTDFVATEPENDRKLSAYELAKAINARGKMVYEIPKPENAVALAMSIASGYDVVLFTGSLYLIGKVRTLLREKYLAPGNICFDRQDESDDLTPALDEDD